MVITIVAVLCQLGTASCREEIVTDSTMDDSLTLQSCMLGQPAVVKWIGEHPVYHTGYRLERWKCIPGKYEKKGAA
jgi:hypothetical protein